MLSARFDQTQLLFSFEGVLRLATRVHYIPCCDVPFNRKAILFHGRWRDSAGLLLNITTAVLLGNWTPNRVSLTAKHGLRSHAATPR